MSRRLNTITHRLAVALSPDPRPSRIAAEALSVEAPPGVDDAMLEEDAKRRYRQAEARLKQMRREQQQQQQQPPPPPPQSQPPPQPQQPAQPQAPRITELVLLRPWPTASLGFNITKAEGQACGTVSGIAAGHVAAEAQARGDVDVGDVFTHINGVEVPANMSQLDTYAMFAGAGNRITLRLVRRGSSASHANVNGAADGGGGGARGSLGRLWRARAPAARPADPPPLRAVQSGAAGSRGEGRLPAAPPLARASSDAPVPFAAPPLGVEAHGGHESDPPHNRHGTDRDAPPGLVLRP